MAGGETSVLVVSPDVTTREQVSEFLHGIGCEVRHASSHLEAAPLIAGNGLDLVVADVRASTVTPYDILVQVRRSSAVPVLMLIAPDSETAGECMELGADDCMVWPSSPRELRARVLLRRSGRSRQGSTLVAGALRIDALHRVVRLAGRQIALRDREFDLLTYLATSPGETFTSEQLLADVWHSRREWQVVRTVTEHIYRLRKKLERDPTNPKHIVTVRGHGYRFEG